MQDDVAGGRHQPYYHVLVDHRDRPFQSTYVAQENIVRAGSGESSSSNQVKLCAAQCIQGCCSCATSCNEGKVASKHGGKLLSDKGD